MSGKTQRLAGEATLAALSGTAPVDWQAAEAKLADDVRRVVRGYARVCPHLDEEELSSFLMFVGGVALVKAYSTPDLWCDPAAYAGTAIRRKAGTYVLRMRSPASFKEWDARTRYQELVAGNQAARLSRVGQDGELSEQDVMERALANSVAEPASEEADGPLEAALQRVRELISRRPVAQRHLLEGESLAALARELGEPGALRLEVAAARTAVARDGVLRGLVRLLGVSLARDPGRQWTLACVAVDSGRELEVDWPEPPAYRTPDEAWDAAERMELAYYQRDPDATIEVKFVARRAAGVEEP